MKSGAACWREDQTPNLACAIVLPRFRTPISAAPYRSCPRVSNRQTELVETRLSDRKQSTEPRSNRQILDLLEIRSARTKLEIIPIGELFSA
jgi:hypothetical protein